MIQQGMTKSILSHNICIRNQFTTLNITCTIKYDIFKGISRDITNIVSMIVRSKCQHPKNIESIYSNISTRDLTLTNHSGKLCNKWSKLWSLVCKLLAWSKELKGPCENKWLEGGTHDQIINEKLEQKFTEIILLWNLKSKVFDVQTQLWKRV